MGRAREHEAIGATNRALLCLAAASVFALPLAADARTGDVAPDARALFGGDGVRAIADATTVEIARLHSTRGALTYSIGHAYVVRPELGRELANNILDPHTYPVHDSSPCKTGRCGEATIKLCGGFDPGVVVRFHGRGGRVVDALLCFKCEDLGAVSHPSNRTSLDRQPTYLVPRNVDKADMAPGALALLRLVDRAFPGDADLLTALKRAEERHH